MTLDHEHARIHITDLTGALQIPDDVCAELVGLKMHTFAKPLIEVIGKPTVGTTDKSESFEDLYHECHAVTRDEFLQVTARARRWKANEWGIECRAPVFFFTKESCEACE